MKTRVKKLCLSVLLILTIVCVFSFTGCVNDSGSYVIKNAKTTTKNGDISATYSYFNGTRKYSYKFGGGEEISVTFVTEDGALSYKITDGKGNAVKEGTANNDSFVIKVEEAGKYTFEFTASAHKGSYKMTW